MANIHQRIATKQLHIQPALRFQFNKTVGIRGKLLRLRHGLEQSFLTKNSFSNCIMLKKDDAFKIKTRYHKSNQFASSHFPINSETGWKTAFAII